MPQYGFIRDKLQVKFLVLFILNQLKQPISFSDLAEISMCDKAVGYFEFSDAAAELLASGHMEKIQDGEFAELFSITKKGAQNASISESSLPYAVRMAAQRSMLAVLSRIRREASVQTKITENDDELTVACSLSDDQSRLISVELLVANPQQAALIEQNFKQNAVSIYNAVIGAMLKDYTQPMENYEEEES